MRSFRSYLFILLLALTAFSAVPVSSSAQTSAAPAQIADSESAVPEDASKDSPNKFLSLVVDKSTYVTLGASAATIFVANPEIADVQVVTPRRIMVMGKKPGETTLLISDEGGRVLANRTIIVSHDMAELERALSTIAPLDKLKAKAVPNGIVLTGETADPTIMEAARRVALRYIPKDDGDVINRIKLRANNQIQIQVRFAEVSREVDKRFGINWENAIRTGNFVFSLATGPDFFQGVGQDMTRTVMGDSTNNAIGVNYSDRRASVNGMIDALAKDGLVTVLAEPTLTAMSGETASFLAGGEFPIPVPQGENITIEWKQYGVSLSFTPTIIGENRINLHVRPEVSQLSEVGSITLSDIAVPALTTRRAETTVELGSGQSFAIAGLLNNNQTQSIDKFPFLGDMPVLGALFRSTRFQNNESELVIIITPYIVKPTTQEQLALPTDGYSQPTDADMLVRLRQTNSDPEAPPMSGAPRAAKVDLPKEAPAPKSAPVLPVAPPKKAKAEPMASTAPAMSLPPLSDKKKEEKQAPASASALPPAPRKITPQNTRPPGPGGFIME